MHAFDLPPLGLGATPRVARLAATALLVLSSGLTELAAQRAPTRVTSTTLLGQWRVTRGMVSPWVAEKSPRPDARAWLGQELRVSADRVDGPGVLSCAHAHYETTSFPADALFQASLPQPARKSAAALGVGTLPAAGVSLNCDSGLFEFHIIDENAALVAVDNVIGTLSRTTGAVAQAASPAGIVERLLESHFARDMAFEGASVAAARPWLSPALHTLMTRYLAKPSSPDQVPAIDGDPFTDSQEYPTPFAVNAAVIRGATATVSVLFNDSAQRKTVV